MQHHSQRLSRAAVMADAAANCKKVVVACCPQTTNNRPVFFPPLLFRLCSQLPRASAPGTTFTPFPIESVFDGFALYVSLSRLVRPLYVSCVCFYIFFM
eukprot:scaffold1044_cov120-Isochrysis_galbana.AAC.6